MLCPECNNELWLDHTTNVVIDMETYETQTNYFYTCMKPGCGNYRKIINGAEEGKEAMIQEATL